MPNSTDHPTDHELSAFALGDLPLEAAEQVEQHISECDSCCETIVSLATDDTFLGLLQTARASDAGTENTAASLGSDDRDDEIPAPLLAHARYEIDELIGRGGMGRVYKARHRMMDRAVALKVIHHKWVNNQEAIDRFHREMKSAASLDHPHIVTAHDAEQADDLHFLVMEYVDGTDLAQTVRQQGPQSVQQACDFIRQAAAGLQHAHEQGMVHRDIKPHNLIVTGDNVVKILDFGLASLSPQVATSEAVAPQTDDKLTIAGAIMGTPDFISPEQAVDARSVDGRSDIYSLGMTLYFLLAGRVPFEHGTATEKLRQHAEAAPTPLAELRDDVPPAVQTIFARMTARHPDERYQSPAEVIAAIDLALRPQPVHNQPARRGARTWWLGGAMIAALLIAAGLFFAGREERVAKADYQQLRSYLESGQSSEDHSILSDRLLQSAAGRRYLRILDAEHPKLAFVEGEFARGYTSVVAYIFENAGGAGTSPDLLVRGRSLLTMGMRTQSIYEGFQVRSIRFDNGPDEMCTAIVQFETRSAGTPLLGLKPDSIYETRIPINELIAGRVQSSEVFSTQSEYLGGTASSSMTTAADSQLHIANARIGPRTDERLQYGWNLSGKNLDGFHARLMLARDGQTEVVQEFTTATFAEACAGELLLTVTREAGEVGQRIDARMENRLFGLKDVQTFQRHVLPLQVDATGGNGGVPQINGSIEPDAMEVVYHISFHDQQLRYDPTFEGIVKASGEGAVVLFVVIDWQTPAQQSGDQPADNTDEAANTAGGNIASDRAGDAGDADDVGGGHRDVDAGDPAEQIGEPDPATPFDLSQVPDTATRIIGCRPRQILKDARLAVLRDRRLPFRSPVALFFQDNVAEFLEVELSTDGATKVYIVTVAHGSPLEVADQALTIAPGAAAGAMGDFGSTTDYPTATTVNGRLYVRPVSRRTVVIGTQEALRIHRQARQKTSTGQLAQLAASLPQSVLLAISDRMTSDEARDLRYLAEEFAFPSLDAVQAFGQRARYFGLSLSLGPQPTLQLVAQADDEDAQQDVARQLRALPAVADQFLQRGTAADLLGFDAPTTTALAACVAAAGEPRTLPHRTTPITQLTIPLQPAAALLQDWLGDQFGSEQEQRRAAEDLLQQIGLAFHNFEVAHGHFPGSSTQLPGATHPVSWRVALLPYLGEQALYDQYRLQEPWNSPHNLQLLDQMPAVYRHPNAWQRGTTANHVVFTGDTATGTALEPRKLSSITDGTSRTLLVVEAATAIPWTKPEDLMFDPAAALPPLGDLSRDGWHATLADGRVIFFSSETPADVIKALITPAGSEPIVPDGETFRLNGRRN